MPTTLTAVQNVVAQLAAVEQRVDLDVNQTIVTLNVIPSTVTLAVVTGGGTSSGGSAHTIMDEGSAMPAENNLDFVGAGVTVTDVPGSGSTRVTIPGTSPGANFLDMAIWGTD